MNQKKIINQLKELIEYATDEIRISDCYEIWAEDVEALRDAILSVKMLHDIFENLSGQDMFGEMIAALSQMGYTPEDFDRLQICTVQEVKEYIENYMEV